MTWTTWIEELVEWDENELMTRGQAIHKLCNYGLVPFLASYGYSVTVAPKDLGSRIATGLYKNQGKTYLEGNWQFGPVENEYMTEEYNMQFGHDINQNAWETFWGLWGVWEDIDDTEFGKARQREIQEYIWSQVDGEVSPKLVQLRALNEDDEYETELDGGDAYLKDARESNEWGGVRK
jgi:hypothetical protein